MPTHTLVLIKSDRIARADFNASAPETLVHFAQAPRRNGLGLAELTESALALGSSCGRKVWVLCEDLWTSAVTLPATAIAGLDKDALSRAIAFESEPLSGIPAFDAVAGFTPLGNSEAGQSFWTTVLPSAERDRIQAAIKEAGGRLIGLSHPAGVPVSLVSNAAKDWRRSELWSQVSVCIDAKGKGPRVQIFGSGGGQSRQQNAISSWRLTAVADCTESLIGRANTTGKDLNAQGNTIALESDAELKRWLAAWARVLVKAPDEVLPVIAAAVQPVSAGTVFAVALALELLVAGLCWFHYADLTSKLTAARASAADSRAAIEQLNTLKKKADTLRTEVAKLELEQKKKDDARELLTREMDLQRSRIGTLLNELSAARPDDVIVQSIKSEASGRVLLSGVALDATQADELAARLSTRIKPVRLEVVPILKQKQQPLEGSPWNFVLLVQHTDHATTTESHKGKPVIAAANGGSAE